ncbi:MAG: small multi-drug export protein [Candidatus Bipolaricaulia bacterium]
MVPRCKPSGYTYLVTTIDYLITVALSAAPIAELRGGLPYALARGLHPAAAFFLAVAANLLIVPVILLGLGIAERLLRRWRPAERVLDAVFARTRRKGRLVERFGNIGLILLVAIPLPGTGAWTGAIAAVLLGVPARRAFCLITLGVLIAGTLVLFASLGAFRLFGLA